LIASFKDKESRKLFETGRSRKFRAIERIALRKLDQLEAAAALDDMRAPPGNRLESLKGNRAGQHSVRVNDQYRVCFRWTSEGVQDVEITDYHW
jgi:proteic killer suppression protein